MELDQRSQKAIARLRFLLMSACVLSGLLTGETVDRLVIGFPAWKYTGIAAWAEYSRHADLGNGVFVYPLEGMLSFLLLLASSVLLITSKNIFIKRHFSLSVHLSTVFAVIALILTFFAAPFILSLKNIDDPALEEFAFNRFFYWSTYRGISQGLSFLSCVWAMSKAFIINYSEYNEN